MAVIAVREPVLFPLFEELERRVERIRAQHATKSSALDRAKAMAWQARLAADHELRAMLS